MVVSCLREDRAQSEASMAAACLSSPHCGLDRQELQIARVDNPRG